MCVKNAMLEELITLEVPLPSARRQLSPLPSRRIINPSSKARRGEREYPPGGIRHLLAPPETRVPCAPTPSPDTYGHPQTRTHGYALPAHADTRTSPVLLPPHCHPPPPPPRSRLPGSGRTGTHAWGCPAGSGTERGGLGLGPPPAAAPHRGPAAGKAALPVSSPRTSWKRRGVGALTLSAPGPTERPHSSHLHRKKEITPLFFF